MPNHESELAQMREEAVNGLVNEVGWSPEEAEAFVGSIEGAVKEIGVRITAAVRQGSAPGA